MFRSQQLEFRVDKENDILKRDRHTLSTLDSTERPRTLSQNPRAEIRNIVMGANAGDPIYTSVYTHPS